MAFLKNITSGWSLVVFSVFVCGVVATIAGFAGMFFPWLSVLLVFPVISLGSLLLKNWPELNTFSKTEKSILWAITTWWLLHLIQVFVPETGFDALWYHLPVAKGVLEHHGFFIDLNLYQSFNPLFSDSIFLLGFAAFGELGAKLVAYLFGVLLVGSSYVLARKLLNRQWSLVTVLLVSGFQVVSWQSASFYIDVAKAFWEVSALVFLLNKDHFSQLKSFALFGASLASKAFSLLLLPVFLILSPKKDPTLILMATVSIIVAAPYFLFSYFATGEWFYSLTHHINKLGEIGGNQNIFQYLLTRLLNLWYLPIELLLTKEYLSPLLVLFFPLVVWLRKEVASNKPLRILTLFTVFQLAIWWFVPPLSVRYALSGFITMAIVTVFLLLKAANKLHFPLSKLIWVCLILGVMFMPIRLMIAARSIKYLTGQQTKREYLEQFRDGNIDQVLMNWHASTFAWPK